MIAELFHNNRNIHSYSFPQRSPQWYAIRKDKWTGSVAIDLLLGKTEPPAVSDYDNDYMLRGRILEDRAIEGYEVAEHGCTEVVERYGFIVNEKYPNAGYSPDAIDGDILLEVKCFGIDGHNDLVAGKLTPKIISQVQFGLLITGLKHAKLIAYNPEVSPSLAVIDIKRNEKVVKNIKEKLHAHYERNKERY